LYPDKVFNPHTEMYVDVLCWRNDDSYYQIGYAVEHVRGSEECFYSIKLTDGFFVSVANDVLVSVEKTPRRDCQNTIFDVKGKLLGSFTDVTAGKTDQIVSEQWNSIEGILKVHPRVLLWGPPGTGKTTAAVNVDEPRTLVTTVTEETPAAELRGHYIPKGNEFIWHDGIAISAWREGLRLVINEPDRSSSDVLTFLYAISDDPSIAKFTLPTGETVRPDEKFQVVLTMNGDPTMLPAALRDRFSVSLHVTEPHPMAIQSLPEDLRSAARGSFVPWDTERSLSIRQWKEFAALRDRLGPDELNTAAWGVFGDRATDILNTLKLTK
jgi:hypothetical protein